MSNLGNCEEVLVTLRKIMRAVDLSSKRLMKEFGLTGPQMVVLRAIEKNTTLTTGDLAKLVSLSHPTVTSILDRLVKRNLVIREKSQKDKRRINLSLTSAAEQLLRKTPLTLQEEFVRSFSRLKDWEQNQILSSLQRVANMMDAQNYEASPILDSNATVPR